MKINVQENLVKLFAIFAFLMVNLGWGQVTLPHYDGINYTIGTALQTKPGWSLVNSGDDIIIGSGSLSNNNLPASNDNKITFDGQGIDAAKAFTSQSVGFGTLYFSFMLRVTNISGLSATTGGYFTGITDTSNGFASTVWLRSDGVGGYQIGLAPRTSNVTTIWGPSRALNTNYLVVVSLTSITGLTNDISKLWVDPVLNGAEPTPSLSITNAGIDLTAVNRILVRQGASASETPFVEMDELRIGLTFESVVINIWNGTAWTNGTPTATSNSLINNNYSTVSNGAIVANDLYITTGGLLTVNPNANVTLSGTLINTLTADKLIVQSNANIIQSSTSTNIGNITVNRNSTPMYRLDYTYWSSPVAGQNLLNFSPLTSVSPTIRFYDYDENANDFTNVGLPTNFVQGKGYSIRAPNTYTATSTGITTTFAGSFVGVPNNGSISVPVFNTGGPKGYNLIGNPYPSPIIGSIFMGTNTNISTLYFWNHFAQGGALNSNYATFNGVGAVAAAGGATPSGIIQTGQGFIVKATAGPNVTFTNAMRTADYGNQFFRTSNSNVTSNETDKNRIWLKLSDSDAVMNQTLVGYVPNATNNLDDAFDANLFDNIGSRLYSVINNEAFVIQGKALPFSNTDSVALGFRTDVAGNYSIAIGQVDGLFAGNQNIFLMDNLTGTTHNIKQTPYNFASAVGTFNSRFSLVYQAVLSSENPNFDANSIIVFTKDNAISINAGLTSIQNVQLFDIRGSLVYEKNNVNATSASINDLNVSNGVMIVKITSQDGKIVSKKLIF